MSEDKKDKGTDLGRNRPLEISDWQEPEKPERKEDSTGSRMLRGCAIALGIAALIFFFVGGACFIALSSW